MTGKIKQFLWAMRPQHPFPRVSEEDDATYIARYTIQMEELAAECIEEIHNGRLDEDEEGTRLELKRLLIEAGKLDSCDSINLSIVRNAMRLVQYRLISEVLNEMNSASSGNQIDSGTPLPVFTHESVTDKKIISSTEGLAEFLGCGKTKAFEIIKSGILKEAGIQYRVGKCWKFNAEKLSEYLRAHPDFLE